MGKKEHVTRGVGAQGEDVVAGVRTPSPIALLEQEMPQVYKELLANVETLERHFGDMQVCVCVGRGGVGA